MEGHTLRRSKRLSSQNAAIEDSNEAPLKKTKTRKVMKKVVQKNGEQDAAQKEMKTVKKVEKRKVAKRKVSKIQNTKTEKQNTTSTTTLNTDHLLLDLGTLVKGTLVKRPSATIKSPYVSDVKIVDEDGNEKIVLAHSPALDVGGLCSVGTTVLMSTREGGKTSHAIELLLTDDATGDSKVLVGAHPQLGEKISEKVLQMGLLQDVINYGSAKLDLSKRSSSPKKKKAKSNTDLEEQREGTILRRQVTYGDSRVDYELTDYDAIEENKFKTLLEVKNVVCADFRKDIAPEKRNPNHCVIVSEADGDNYKRNAIFPWGKIGQTFEGKKVVSERAIKHLRNLGDLTSKNKDIRAVILFVINRSDCEEMRACHEQCPVFAAELKSVSLIKGVTVTSFRVRWTEDGKAYFDGIVPVSL